MTIAANLLTRWGRFMLDLVRTLQDLQAWHVSLVAQSGLQFDLSTSQGKLIASVMAALAEFQRDLLRERVRSRNRSAASSRSSFWSPMRTTN
jgi:putative DNA-invertase from lambdoid prophage Rac